MTQKIITDNQSTTPVIKATQCGHSPPHVQSAVRLVSQYAALANSVYGVKASNSAEVRFWTSRADILTGVTAANVIPALNNKAAGSIAEDK